MTDRVSAYEKSIAYISRQPRTEYQVGLMLAKASYDDDEIRGALRELREDAYIDDVDYASRYLEVLIERRKGRRRIADDMKRHGLRPEVYEPIIADGYTQEREDENALAASRKALANLPDDMDYYKIRSKLSLKLMSLGYGYDVINRTLRTVLAPGDDMDYEYGMEE